MLHFISFPQVAVLVLALVAVALARPSDIVDFETDTLDHEQSVGEKVFLITLFIDCLSRYSQWRKNNNLTLTHVHPIAKSISNHTFH